MPWNASEYAARTPVLITEEDAGEEGKEGRSQGAARYIFGDMMRGLYVVGCLALALFAGLQIRLLIPDLEAVVLPPEVAAFGTLGLLELRLYRRLWPPRKGRRIVAAVDRRGP